MYRVCAVACLVFKIAPFLHNSRLVSCNECVVKFVFLVKIILARKLIKL